MNNKKEITFPVLLFLLLSSSFNLDKDIMLKKIKKQDVNLYKEIKSKLEEEKLDTILENFKKNNEII